MTAEAAKPCYRLYIYICNIYLYIICIHIYIDKASGQGENVLFFAFLGSLCSDRIY